VEVKWRKDGATIIYEQQKAGRPDGESDTRLSHRRRD
jgi:hypothetical protein